MTANLSFNLPEEKREFDAAIQGEQWRGIVADLDEVLRRQIKDDKDSPECHLQSVRDAISELLAANNLSFY